MGFAIIILAIAVVIAGAEIENGLISVAKSNSKKRP